MKILNKVNEIFDQYELKLVELSLPKEYKNIYDYLKNNPDKKNEFISEKDDNYLFNKYCSHIPEGWYGFSIGSPIIPAWCEIIDKILELCIDTDPNFEINQIKIKFGGIRFYVHSNIIEDIFGIEILIEDRLYDNLFVY